MVLALAKEMEMRKSEFQDDIVETIYFGGGTPSILQIADLRFLIDEVHRNFKVIQNPEITIEANPDDLTENRIIELSKNKNIKDLHHRISTIDVSQSLIISPRDLKKHEEREKKKLKEAYRILDEAELLVSQNNSSLEASVNQILSFKDSLRKVVGRKKQF